MLVKDQMRIRMEELGITPVELGRRINVAGQTVRCWVNGRNFPNKKMTSEIERELSFKIDYSEGAAVSQHSVANSIQNSAVNALVAINKLPANVQLLFHRLAEAYEVNYSSIHRDAAMIVEHQHQNQAAAGAAPKPYSQQRPQAFSRRSEDVIPNSKPANALSKAVKSSVKSVVKPLVKGRNTATA